MQPSTGGIMLIAEHFDTGPVPVLGAEGDSQDVTLGNVDVDHLDVERLTVGGTEVTPSDDED